MAEGRTTAGREVWVYGLLAFAIGVAATLIVALFLSRGAIRSPAVSTPLPRAVIVAQADDPVAQAWLTALVEAELDTAYVEPQRYEPGDHLLVIVSLASNHSAITAEVRRRISAGGGIILVGEVPSAVAELIGTTARSADVQTAVVRTSERASPLLARVRPGIELPAAPAPRAVLEETPAMVVDARWTEPPAAAIAHWTNRRARIAWFGTTLEDQDLRNVPMLGVLVRAATRWAAGQPISDGALRQEREGEPFSAASRQLAQDHGLGYSAQRSRNDEIEVVVVNRGTESLSNAQVRIWLPADVRSAGIGREMLRTPDATLTEADGGDAVDLHIPSIEPSERRSYRLELTLRQSSE